MQGLFDLINVGNAALVVGNKYKTKYSKLLGTGYYMAYYFFNSKKANLEVKKFHINPNMEVALRMWNLLDTDGFKHIYIKSLPSVQYRKKLYLKKQSVEITKALLANLIDKINSSSLNFSQYDSSIIHDDYLLNISNKDISFSGNHGETYKCAVEGQESADYVKIKILHNRSLFIEKLKPFFSFDCCTNKCNYTRDSLIIHIHGGGWIAMSSTSHENYLRKWTKTLDVPIISIDYRLAPDYPYPKALDDCWQAYNWIIKNASEEFNIDIRRIILVGDSAGGNLVLGLTYLLIIHKIRLPDSIILAYPCCRVSVNEFFYPSYLLALQDKILPYHLIQFCTDSYKNDYKRLDDPFLEPILMDDLVLKHMPPVTILCGSSDPLRDDIITYLNRLTKLDKECKLYELKYFPHGFLNYDLPHMVPEAKIGNDIIIEEMEKVFSA